MTRSAGELKKFLETIPDSEEISFLDDGISFGHESDGAFGCPLGFFMCTAQFMKDESDDEEY